jgi:NAD(P)-dependent dehydrogenase (short-subunit alcohol dehydrogenase family)
MNRMDGKICVVTGSTQGLGAAITQRFAKAAMQMPVPEAPMTLAVD